MLSDELFDNLEERELEILAIRLQTSAQISSLRLEEYIALRLLQGTTRESLKAELIKDLTEGGRLFGEFRNSVQATAHGNIRRISDIGVYIHEGQGVNDMRMWITVGDNNVCPDCAPRHGQVKTMEAWEVLGLPRTGWSICRDHCRCTWGIASMEKPSIITRKRRKK